MWRGAYIARLQRQTYVAKKAVVFCKSSSLLNSRKLKFNRERRIIKLLDKNRDVSATINLPCICKSMLRCVLFSIQMLFIKGPQNVSESIVDLDLRLMK